jgi:hypothetical protein
MSVTSESVRYIVRKPGNATADWLTRVLELPGAVLLRTKDEHALLRMPLDSAERLHREFPELTIEEDVRHRMVHP